MFIRWWDRRIARAARAVPVLAGVIYFPALGWPVPPDVPFPVAFTSDRSGAPRVYVLEPGADEPTRLTGPAVEQAAPNAGDGSPAWSPDGRMIAFDRRDEWPYFESIFQVPAAGGAVEPVVRAAYQADRAPAWSPEGDRLVFTRSDRTYNQYLMVLDMRSHTTSYLAGEYGGQKVREGAWSPDGTHVAYCGAWPGEPYMLFVRDVVSGATTQLTTGPGHDCAADWSPDGALLAYTSIRPEGTQIYLIDVDGSSVPRRVTNLGGVNSQPSWSPDGAWIAFASTRSGNSDVLALRLADNALVSLTRHPAADTQPAFAPPR